MMEVGNQQKFHICNAHIPWVRIGLEGYPTAILSLNMYLYFFVFVFLFLTIKMMHVLENSVYLRPSPHQYGNGLKHLNMK